MASGSNGETGSTSNTPQETTAEVVELTDRVMVVFDRLAEAYHGMGGIEVKRQDGARARVAVALVAETFAAGAATKVLAEERLEADALTSARRAFEHAVTVAWLLSDHGSADAFVLRKGSYTAAKLARAIRQAGIPIDPEVLSEAEKNAPSRKEVEAALINFEEMCNVFNSRLYIAYRVVSGYVHPSLSALDRAFGDRGDRSPAAGTMLAMHLATASAVWAGSALDKLHVGQPLKRELKRAATELWISRVLYPGMHHDGVRWPV